ncbi:MAG: prephenate dehydrogenase/arogenate dehydrogenase family protein [Desulforhopalus sp.]|nr:prephenate dehydrogenase/arogenate dehydrogenase family protein [Desulforhopalus sp.]
MFTIATLGPEGSNSWQAACQYNPAAKILTFGRIREVFASFTEDCCDIALVPVYNTREGSIREYYRKIAESEGLYWVDNVVLPIHVSLFSFQADFKRGDEVHTVIGRASVLRQSRDFLDSVYPDATQMAVHDIDSTIKHIGSGESKGFALIDTEEVGRRHGLTLVERELASHNRTRFAVVARHPAVKTGYDATAVITIPLKDRVGLLVDILNEFTRRGINIIDLQSENDVKTQKLQIYLEFEGHKEEPLIAETLHTIEEAIIQEKDSLYILGSFPRVDMREKNIKSIGFIGTGAMSRWFAERLRGEGYRTLLTGRTTTITPEEMIGRVDVVMICVPISVTTETIRHYAPKLRDGQALIILAGESEHNIEAALTSSGEGVEVMFIHNLWGPQSATMKDKHAAVVHTSRAGALCNEIEAFLYKHGADIYQDSPRKHDLLMGVGQKLPTTISVALAKTFKDHNLDYKDIASHSTLTSLYGILAMARIHSQNPRTYAEIMATGGEGRKIVRSFAENILKLMDLAENSQINALCELMEENRSVMPAAFLEARMAEAKAVDEILSRPGIRKA